MKQQTTALLLSALLLSTFAHDHWRASHNAPPALKHEKSHPQSLAQLQSRDNEQCFDICVSTSVNASTAIVVIISENGDIGLLNNSTNIAIIINIQYNLVIIVNGNTGYVLIFNTETQQVVIVEAGSSIGWLVSNVTFAVYLASLGNQLQAAFTSGTKISITLISVEVQQFILKVLISFDYRITVTSSQAAALFIQITGSLAASFRVLGKTLASGTVVIYGGITILVSRLQGLVYLIVTVLKISIQTLITAGVVFRLDILLALSSGFEVISYVTSVLAIYKITVNYAALLTVEALFAVAAQFSGQIGAAFVISVIISYLNSNNLTNTALIQQVISVVITYAVNKNSSVVVEDSFLISIKKLANISSEFANSAVITGLLNGSLIYRGVNISALVEVLAGTAQTVIIDIVVAILVIIAVDISLKILIPLLIIQFALYFGTAFGRVLLQTIFGIQITVSALILGFLKINWLALLSGDIYSFLISISGIGDIVLAINKAIIARFGAQYDLKINLSGNALLRAAFRYSIDVVIKALRNDSAAITTITNTIGFTFGFGVSFNYNITTTGNGNLTCGDKHLESKLKEPVQHIHSQHQIEKHQARIHDNHISGIKQVREKHQAHHEKHQSHEKLHKGY